MAEAQTDKRWALSGVVFFVLYVVGFIILGGGSPSEDSKIEKVMSYFRDNRGKSLAAVVAVAIAAVSMVMFASYVRQALRRTGGDDVASSVVLGGGVVVAAGLLFMAAVRFALVSAVHSSQNDVARVLNVLDNNDFFVLVGGLATLFLGTGIALLGRRLLPRWLGWVSVVLGVVTLAGPLGMLSFFLAPLWVLIVSIMLSRTDDSTPGMRLDAAS